MSTSRRIFAAVLLSIPGWNLRAAEGPGFTIPEIPGPPAGVEPIVRNDSTTIAASDFSPWDVSQRPARESLHASNTNDCLLGSFTFQQTLRDGDIGTVWDDPLTRRGWQADQAWKLNVLESFFFFGQASAAAEDALQQDAKMNGRTGLGWQVPLTGGELLLRGATNVSYSDPLRVERARERSEFLLEMQGRYPLLFGVHLEFQGTASPALTPLDRDWVSHEVRLALPVGTSGKLMLGARQRWDNVTDQKPTTDGAQIFLGLELKR